MSIGQHELADGEMILQRLCARRLMPLVSVEARLHCGLATSDTMTGAAISDLVGAAACASTSGAATGSSIMELLFVMAVRASASVTPHTQANCEVSSSSESHSWEGKLGRR